MNGVKSIGFVFAVSLGPLFASAGGSVPAEEIAKLTKKAPRLGSDIQKQLSTQNKGSDAFSCTSARVGLAVDPKLAGARVGPFNCNVGDRELEITVHRSPAAAKASKKISSDGQGSITWQWK